MQNLHVKNTVRYFLLLVVLLVFLFFSNDFGLLDVEKTAIVTAIAIDKKEDEFIITSQIAVPQPSKQGDSSKTVQLVSRGKTVAQAIERLNAKTGWYPKLVFCNLILLGRETTNDNVFDALDFFLRNEYLSNNCLLAACDGEAKEVLDNAALVDSTSSLAIEKVLSAHAERVGTVLPVNLRDFAIGYFSDGKSGYLPIVKVQPQQEKTPPQTQTTATGEAQSSNQTQQGNANENPDKQKPVFSAGETALFVGGKRVDTLTEAQTFALSAVIGKLRLAAYSVDTDGECCTLSIRQNSPKIKLTVNSEGQASLSVDLTLSAGIADYSKAQALEEIRDSGNLPDGVFSAAEKRLSAEIHSVFEKTRACNCDVFGIVDRANKYEKRSLQRFQSQLLKNTTLGVTVRFQKVR